MSATTETPSALDLLADEIVKLKAAVAELTINLAGQTNVRRLYRTSPNLLALLQETVGPENIPQPGVHPLEGTNR
jgi:hypothetical protein